MVNVIADERGGCVSGNCWMQAQGRIRVQSQLRSQNRAHVTVLGTKTYDPTCTAWLGSSKPCVQGTLTF